MNNSETEVTWKKYVLSEAVKSTAEIYVGEKGTDKAFRLDTPRRVPLYLRHSFSDKNGRQKVTRFKLGANSIFQQDQIKDDSIPANEPFTIDERNALNLVNGVLVTNDPFWQAFLHEDNNPQREEFTGRNRGRITPILRELDEVAIAKAENTFVRNTAKALTKIFEMEMPEVTALLAIFYGSSFTTPDNLDDCQNLAAKALEGSEERINIVLRGQWNKDDEISILLNKAINQGVITLEQKPDYVQINKDGQWIDFKMISADTYEQREMLLRQYLASQEGELHRKDIESLVAKGGNKKSNKIKQ